MTAAALAASAARASARSRRRVEPAAAALLYGTVWGRAWLVAESPHRAIVQGTPPRHCPALGLATGQTQPGAINTALDQCRAALADVPASGTDPCACRLIALDDTLLAPLDAFAYAPGTDGRLLGLGGVYAGPLVARETATGDYPGASEVVFGNAGQPLAVAALMADGTATLTLLDNGEQFIGRREPEGWQRGRLTERLLLRGEDGRRVIALIGYAPEDFLRDGSTLAAWPRGLPG